jgi:hypothetical protein
MRIDAPKEYREGLGNAVRETTRISQALFGAEIPGIQRVVLDVRIPDAPAVFELNPSEIVVFASDEFLSVWRSHLLDLGRLCLSRFHQSGAVKLLNELDRTLESLTRMDIVALRRCMAIPGFLPYAYAHHVVSSRGPPWYVFGITWFFQFHVWGKLAMAYEEAADGLDIYSSICSSLLEAFPGASAHVSGWEWAPQVQTKDFDTPNDEFLRISMLEIASYQLIKSLAQRFGDGVVRSVAHLPQAHRLNESDCVLAISQSTGVREEEIRQELIRNSGCGADLD